MAVFMPLLRAIGRCGRSVCCTDPFVCAFIVVSMENQPVDQCVFSAEFVLKLNPLCGRKAKKECHILKPYSLEVRLRLTTKSRLCM
jgi:hypothetical protein